MDRQYIKEYPKARLALRIIGFITVGIGLVLTIISVANFFMGNLSVFFLGFIGLPLIGIGSACLIYGYMRTVSGYVAGETTPVVGESVNYIYDDIKNASKKKCPQCGELNDEDSQFCKKCGKQLIAKCPKCGKAIDADDIFCKGCGTKLK